MSKAFDSIKKGLQEAIAHPKGKTRGVKTFTPSAIDVQALRKRIGLTQEEFAAKFGVSLGTLRHWERGDRKPHASAQPQLFGHRFAIGVLAAEQAT